jgi:hypothetical protein
LASTPGDHRARRNEYARVRRMLRQIAGAAA